MPRDLTTYTTCAAPGVAKSHKNYGGFLGWLMTQFLDATALGKGAFVVVFLALLVALIFANPITAVATYLLIFAALKDIATWYYTERLLCVGDGDSCVIGTVLDPSDNSFDGDATFNILPAPYTQKECIDSITEHLKANQGLLTNASTFNDFPFSFVPNIETAFPQSFNSNSEISTYLDNLEGATLPGNDTDLKSNIYNHFLIGFLDRLFKDSSQSFYNHFLRKDKNIITNVDKFNAIPNDYDDSKDWTADNASFFNDRFSNQYELPSTQLGLNLMFRFNNNYIVPFLHCEIDGNNVNILLTTILTTLTALMIFIAAPNIFTAILFLISLIFLLLSSFGDIGEASTPDFDFGDPDTPDNENNVDGDVVAVYGKWIMDTEHSQYFEIHPVKAYYIVGRNGVENPQFDIFDTPEDRAKRAFTKVTNDEITKDIADEICKLISGNEKGEPEPIITRTLPQILSYGLTTKYGGGGIN